MGHASVLHVVLVVLVAAAAAAAEDDGAWLSVVPSSTSLAGAAAVGVSFSSAEDDIVRPTPSYYARISQTIELYLLRSYYFVPLGGIPCALGRHWGAPLCCERMRINRKLGPVRRSSLIALGLCCAVHLSRTTELPSGYCVARCCPSDRRQPLAPREAVDDGKMPSLQARCSIDVWHFQLVPLWRRLCRTRPNRDAFDERTTTTILHVIGSAPATRMVSGTAPIGVPQI